MSNVNSAAQWCRTDGDPTDGVCLGVNLGWYAFLSADVQTDELVLVDLIERAVDAPAELRCRALMWAALLSIGRTGRRTWAMDAVDVAHTAAGTTTRGDPRLAQLDGVAMSLEAITMARATGDDELLLEVLLIGSLHLAAVGWHPDVLRGLNDEAGRLASSLADPWAVAFVAALDGMEAYVAGELDRSMDILRAAITALRAAGDEGTAALFEVSFSEVAELTGAMGAATDAMTVAVEVGTAGGFRSAIVLKAVLCWLAGRNGQVDRALALGQEVVALAHQPFNPVIRAQALFALGVAESLAGDHEAAGDHLREALAIHEQVGMVREAAMDHRHLGDVYRSQGDPARAVEHGRRALEMAVTVGLPWTVMLTARTLARSLVAAGRAGEACQLIAVAGGVTDTFGYAPTPDEQELIDEVTLAARHALGDVRTEQLMAAAASTSFEHVADVLDTGRR
jgi:tetratricopeptide (TPR) repeat protein